VEVGLGFWQSAFDLGVFCVKKFKNIFVKKFPLFEHGENFRSKNKFCFRASFGNFRKYF